MKTMLIVLALSFSLAPQADAGITRAAAKAAWKTTKGTVKVTSKVLHLGAKVLF